jgi:glycosyltransferase involved in cell wall biosynthesis
MSIFNGERYLKQSVESILRQTYSDFEFIIINDGSTDGTEAILNRISDPRIRIVKNSEHLGLTKSLNKGIKISRGKYIARMDADDMSLPSRFKIQVNYLETHPEVAIVGSSYFHINEAGKILSLIHLPVSDAIIREHLLKGNCFVHGSIMMKKEAIQKASGYDERFKYSQDYDLWFRISEISRIANIHKPLYCWRLTQFSISKTYTKEQKYYSSLAVFEAIRRRYLNQASNKPLPLVSVIIPTYNRSQSLLEAIESVLIQEYKYFEIIVVNNGGVDVQHIINDLKGRGNIKYVRHDCNRGLAAARNTGICLSEGKYIAYLDDDDIFYPMHLEILVKYLENSSYKIAYTDAYFAYRKKEDGKYVTTHQDLPYSFDFDEDRILVCSPIPVICVMHQKSCLDEVGLFDEELKFYEDWDLCIRMSRKFKFAHIGGLTCEFRSKEDESTMTAKTRENSIWETKTIHDRYRHSARNRPKIFLEQNKNLVNKLEEVYQQDNLIKELRDDGSGAKNAPDNYGEVQSVMKKGKKEEYISTLQKFVDRNPNHALSHKDLASTYYKLGNKWLALAHIVRCLSIDREDIKAMELYESICFDLGVHNKAIKVLKRILREKPGGIKILIAQGILLLRHWRKRELIDLALERLCYEFNSIRMKSRIKKCAKQLSEIVQISPTI